MWVVVDEDLVQNDSVERVCVCVCVCVCFVFVCNAMSLCLEATCVVFTDKF